MKRSYPKAPTKFLLCLVVVTTSVCRGSSLSRAEKSTEATQCRAADNAQAADNRSKPALIQYFNAYAVKPGVEAVWAARSEEEIKGYQIYRGQDRTSGFILVNAEGIIPLWQQEYVDAGVEPATRYLYVLSVVLANGREYLSQPVEVTTPSRAGVAANGANVSVWGNRCVYSSSLSLARVPR